MSDITLVGEAMKLLSKNWKPLATGIAIGTAVGATATIAYGVATGRVPMWFGPERARWSALGWDDGEARLITALSSATGSVCDHGMHSTRNFVYCGPNPERRIRAQYFFFPAERKLTGVAHFGADCEGPPRCVHGGAIAALADSALGKCAHHCGFKCVTVNLNVNYRRFIGLGSGILMESFFEREEGRKIYLRFLFRSLDGLTTHAEGTALFLKVTGTKSANSSSSNMTPRSGGISASPPPSTPSRAEHYSGGGSGHGGHDINIYHTPTPITPIPITPTTPLIATHAVPLTHASPPPAISSSSSSSSPPSLPTATATTAATAAATALSSSMTGSALLDDGVLVDAPAGHVSVTDPNGNKTTTTSNRNSSPA